MHDIMTKKYIIYPVIGYSLHPLAYIHNAKMLVGQFLQSVHRERRLKLFVNVGCHSHTDIRKGIGIKQAMIQFFAGFQNLHVHYKQAAAALKEGRRRQDRKHENEDDNNEAYAAATYTEYAARCLLQECSKEALDTFRWEVLDDLIRYDRLHHTSYVKTLDCYLSCERNLALTSKKLYIHRNTLIYRIGRLSRLLDCDLENAAVRLRLTLCLEWMRGQE